MLPGEAVVGMLSGVPALLFMACTGYPYLWEEEMSTQKIETLIQEMEDLSTLSMVAVSIMDTLLDENASAQEVAEIVEADPALTAKVLMVANSAFFGMPREVSTVRQAIVSLGLTG